MLFIFCRVACCADLAAPEMRKLLATERRTLCRWLEIVVRAEVIDLRECRVTVLRLECLEPVCSPLLLELSALELVLVARERRAGAALSEFVAFGLPVDVLSARPPLFGNGARIWSVRNCGNVEGAGLSLIEAGFSSGELNLE